MKLKTTYEKQSYIFSTLDLTPSLASRDVKQLKTAVGARLISNKLL